MKKDTQTRNVEDRKNIKKYLTFNLMIDFGTKIKKKTKLINTKKKNLLKRSFIIFFPLIIFF